MVEKVAADPKLIGKLATTADRVIQLCDDSGAVIGYALTPETLRRIELRLIESHVTEEELEAAETDGGEYTMEDVFKLLEQP